MFDQEEYYDSVMAAEAEACTRTSSNSSQNMRNKKSKINTKRFSDEQIQSLESIFETESRLEPRKKLQLARELGLQPRQVAIWFQNKRARWKSKKMERDYNTLLANYNSLAARYEALKKEKQGWLIQLQKLNELMQKPRENAESFEQIKAANSMDSHESSNNGDTMKCEVEDGKPNMSQQGRLLLLSDCNSSIKTEYFALDLEDESDLLNWMEPAEGSLTLQEDWDRFDQSDGLLNESAGVYPWWDFWS